MSTLTWIGVPVRLAATEVRAVVEHAWVNDLSLRITHDGARGITERDVHIEAVVLERTMTLLNSHDLAIDDKRQFRMHRIRHADVLPGTRQASLHLPSTSLRVPIHAREVGIRHLGGDAESGAGVELGGRVGYARAPIPAQPPAIYFAQVHQAEELRQRL